MKNAKVSICIPSYKQVEYLRKTLDSIRRQSFTDFELIVSDDSPDDSVQQLVAQYSFKNIYYWRNRWSYGSPANWNVAITKASGEYIKIMHHDDWFTSKDSLKDFVKMLDDNPHADFAFSATLVLDTKTNLTHVHEPSKKQLRTFTRYPESLFFGNVIGAPSATIFRNTIHEIFDNKVKWVVDIDFYIRLLKKNCIIGYCEKPLICTPDKASHQVTQLCINNKNIELFEYIYLFNKIYNNNIKLSRYYIFFIRIFKKYNVTSMDIFNQLNIKSYPINFFKNVFRFKKLFELKDRILGIKMNKGG